MNSFIVNPNASSSRLTIDDNQFCLVIDDFLLEPELAAAHVHQHGKAFELQSRGYPGSLFIPDGSTVKDIYQFFRSRLSREFDFCRSGIKLASVFSLLTLPPEELDWSQRMCHTDPRTEVGHNNLAGLIFLFEDPRLGGTGFYRLRNREVLQQASKIGATDMAGALAYLQAELPMCREPPCYLADSSDVAELIAAVTPRFNRAIFYSGDIPHSARIEAPELLVDEVSKGRLTLNFFASVIPK